MRRLVALGLVAAALAGCPDMPDGPRYAGAGNARPVRGGTFVFHHESDVRGFDPHLSFDELSNMGIKLMFESLLDYDAHANLVPRLAEALPDVSEDGKTFRFRLRRGVRFHNGREVTAEDVRWSLEHMLHPRVGSPGVTFYQLLDGLEDYAAGRARHVRGIRVLDRYTVELVLTAPDQTFLNAMAMTFAAPVPRENYARWGDEEVARHPIGTGAYVFESWEPGVRVTFTRNPRFFRAPEPYPDRMVFELNLGRDAAFMRFLNGQLDHVHRFTSAGYLTMKRSRRWAPTTAEEPSINLWGLTMNCELPPFDDVHVRRAVAFVVDRERWRKARNFRLRPTGQPIPAGLLGYDERMPEQQRTDLARAREEMRLAGHPDGLREPVTFYIGEGPTGRIYGELAQSDLARIGIRLEIKPVAFPVYLAQTGRRRTAQMALGGWSMDYPDPSNFLDILFHSRSIHPENSENKAFYSNPTLDALLDRARVERDRGRRETLYREASRILVADAPWAFMWSDLTLEAWQPYVRNFVPNPVWDNLYRDVWLDLPRRRIAVRLDPFGGSRLAAIAPLGGR